MRRTTHLSQLIYSKLYPNPKSSDPPNFSSHLAQNLVPEVRMETTMFYGSLETVEARYPGLNYTSKPHRMRLRRFPYHAQLFEAFDALRLTEGEIVAFCRWEGTLWARQRYEKDHGTKVQDTTGQGIPDMYQEGRASKRRRISDDHSRLRGVMEHFHATESLIPQTSGDVASLEDDGDANPKQEPDEATVPSSNQGRQYTVRSDLTTGVMTVVPFSDQSTTTSRLGTTTETGLGAADAQLHARPARTTMELFGHFGPN